MFSAKKCHKRSKILLPDSIGDAMLIVGRTNEDKKKPEDTDENA